MAALIFYRSDIYSLKRILNYSRTLCMCCCNCGCWEFLDIWSSYVQKYMWPTSFLLFVFFFIPLRCDILPSVNNPSLCRYSVGFFWPGFVFTKPYKFSCRWNVLNAFVLNPSWGNIFASSSSFQIIIESRFVDHDMSVDKVGFDNIW